MKTGKTCDSYCHKCVYYSGYYHSCDYILDEGHSRGCPPGRGCDKRKLKGANPYREKKNIIVKSVIAVKEKKQAGRHKKELPPEEEALRMHYYNLGYDDRTIAKLCGTHKTTITRWRNDGGHPTNHPNHSRKGFTGDSRKPVVKVNEAGEILARYESINKAAELSDVCNRTVQDHCAGRVKKPFAHLGYTFKFEKNYEKRKDSI